MKKKETPREIKQKARKAETLKERVHRHLHDINSEITDDDIKNVRTELEIRSGTNSGKKQEGENGKSTRGNKNKAAKKNKQTTLWNNLSEGYDK